MTRLLCIALLLVPVAIVARALSFPDVAIFAVSAVSIIPAAGLIGQSTEQLAHRFGPRLGGLLNATFGNIVELLITMFALHDGLITLVKASITGSIIGNILLSVGLSLLLGGVRNGRQRFAVQQTSVNAAMMILAIAGLYLPAVFATAVPQHGVLEEISLLVAGVLLLMYLAYLVYTVIDRQVDGEHTGALGSATAREAAAQIPEPAERRPGSHSATGAWSVRKSAILLSIATAAAAIAGKILTSVVEPVTRGLGWSEFFVGVMVVSTVGNISEYFSAVRMAWRNRLNVTLSIAAGSSTQVALFVAPVLVLVSPFLGHPLNVIFTPLELAILGMATAIFAYISIDGETNWLEGVQLLGVYALAAIAFFLLPLTEP